MHFKSLLAGAFTLTLSAHAVQGRLSTYDLQDLSKLSKSELQSLNGDLSTTLNLMHRCTRQARDQFDFGLGLKSLSYEVKAPGHEVATLVTSGIRPVPSSQPYETTMTVEAKILEGADNPPDAPPYRQYKCKVTQK